jgi:hypothetical protein
MCVPVWAVHEGMPSFDLHYESSYIAVHPIAPLCNGLLTVDVYHSIIKFFVLDGLPS